MRVLIIILSRVYWTVSLFSLSPFLYILAQVLVAEDDPILNIRIRNQHYSYRTIFMIDGGKLFEMVETYIFSDISFSVLSNHKDLISNHCL